MPRCRNPVALQTWRCGHDYHASVVISQVVGNITWVGACWGEGERGPDAYGYRGPLVLCRVGHELVRKTKPFPDEFTVCCPGSLYCF